MHERHARRRYATLRDRSRRRDARATTRRSAAPTLIAAVALVEGPRTSARRLEALA